MTRNEWSLATVAVGGATLVAAAVLVTPAADATQGQPIIAGQTNTATSETKVDNGGGVYGLTGIGGGAGIEGEATGTLGAGVQGFGAEYGVFGEDEADGATAVFGNNGFPTGIGVEGSTSGSGSGVFGEAREIGVGVNGLSDNGVGVEAQSSSGTALKVVGKARFSRSGVVTVAAGTASLTVQLARVTLKSMVLATAQQAKTVSVKAAVPAKGQFTIQLTGTAPTGGLKVAYFVIN